MLIGWGAVVERAPHPLLSLTVEHLKVLISRAPCRVLAFLTSSKHYVPCTRKRKPLRVLARCGQAINYLALGSASPSGTLPFLFLLWRLRTLPSFPLIPA
jgi:hypothetical protein